MNKELASNQDTKTELRALNQSSADAAATLRGLANGLRAAQALFVAAQLRVADHLGPQPRNREELAVLTGADSAALGRLMRTLCALGIFEEGTSGQFFLTSVGELLRSDVPGSYHAGVLFLAGPLRWQCWSQLLETVRTGASASERMLGMQLFDYYAAHPEESKIHDEAMQAFSASHAKAFLDVTDFKPGEVVVDIGGGSGELLSAILAANPGVRGTLFDLPNVVEHADRVLSASKVAEYCTVEGGSFFERIPAHGDTYLLKQVLHDWDDERAIAILHCCRQYMPPTAKLLIIERNMPEVADAAAATESFFADLEMLVMTSGGRERTAREFSELLDGAGFNLMRAVPTASPLSVFEARAD
jgi:O-methyltransferase domain/Dimerisation domain